MINPTAYDIALNKATIGTWTYCYESDSLSCSTAMCLLHGVNDASNLDNLQKWKSLIHPDDAAMFFSALKAQKSISVDCRILWPDESIRYLHYQAEVSTDQKELSGICIDNTPQKTAELLLKNTQNELHSLLNSSTHVCIIATNLKGIITHFNKGAELLLGYKATDVVGKETPGIFHLPSEIERRIIELKTKHGVEITGFDLYEKHLEYGDYEDLYWTYVRKDGSTVPVQLAVSPIKNDQNEITGMLGIATEVSEQKRFEKSLKESEQRWHLTFEHAAVGMAIVSLEGKWNKVNKSLCGILGYTEKELLQKTFQEITHPEDLESDIILVKKLLNNELKSYNLEKRYFHKNGSIIWIMLSAALVRDEAGNPLHFVSQIQDITKRKLAEEENAYLGSLIKDMNDAVFSTDLSFVIKSWNNAAVDLFGFSTQEAIGSPSSEITRPDISQEKRQEIFKFLVEQGIWKGSIDYFKKDGSKFTGLISMSVTKTPQGDISGYVGFIRDVSETKQLQQQQYETIQIVNEQNKRLINFAHIVSHNLRSHAGNFSILLDLYSYEKDDTEKTELIRLLNLASSKLSETIDSLNEIIYIQSNINEQRKDMNLKAAIQESIRSVAAEIQQQHADIRLDVPKDLTIKYVSSYLDSILLNFITNALKYRHPDRNPEIIFKAVHEEKHIILYISDNGLGIDLEKYRDKLFGMYQTFHDHKNARGIGLFITKSQVESMGGKIEVESIVNKGTTFKVYL